MVIRTVAILSPGDMGHAVGKALCAGGKSVITDLSGRSEHTRTLAKRAGIADAGGLALLVERADLILSILPPASALALARRVARTITQTGAAPVYADMNAVSPQTARDIERVIADAGAAFVDGGIIGPALGRGGVTKFYVSGPDTAPVEALDNLGIRVVPIGGDVGRASAIKMCYAGITKGRSTLYTAALMTAARNGLFDEFLDELKDSQPDVHRSMAAMIPRLPADSGRWIGEMHEIAATFEAAGLTRGYHDAAAWMFELLAQSPFADETRETIDPDRGIEESIQGFLSTLARRDGDRGA